MVCSAEVIHLHNTFASPQAMNQEQLEAAYKLLNLMDADAVAQADAAVFGNWYRHLSDHLLEALEDSDK